MFAASLKLVYLLFDSSLYRVWCRFTLGVGLHLLPEKLYMARKNSPLIPKERFRPEQQLFF
jgi:hypothetical protein